MNPLSCLCRVLGVGLLVAGAFELGRRERFTARRTFATPSSSSAAKADSPRSASPSSAASVSALAHAEAALSASLAAGHWYFTREWRSLLDRLEPAELEQFIRTVHAVDRRLVRDPLLVVLLSRWGEYDATRALAWAESVPDKAQRRQATLAVARGWAQASPDTWLAWLRAQPAGTERIALLTSTIGALARSRPVEALALLEREPGREMLHAQVGPIFRTWAASDPRAAAARARQVTPEYLRVSALRAVVQSWSDRNPQAALAFARSLPADVSGGRREVWISCATARDAVVEVDAPDEDIDDDAGSTGRLAGSVLGLMARKDADQALAAVRNLPAGREREGALQDIARSLLSTDPEMAIAFATGLQPGPAQAALMQEIARRYASSDPAAALAWACALPDGTPRINALRTIATQLANADPCGAIALLETLPEGSGRQHTIAHIAGTWARRDPGAAVAWANTVADPAERSSLLRAVAGPWMKHDPVAALAFALSQPKNLQSLLWQEIGPHLADADARTIQEFVSRIPDPAAQGQLLQRTVQALMYQNPAEAAALLSRSANAATPYVLSEIGRQWASDDPVKAAQWISNLSGAASRLDAFDSIASTWTFSDPQAAARWISSLPAGKERDIATRGYIGALAATVPEIAAPAVLTISDPQIRLEAVDRVARSWIANDRRAAAVWLATVPLSPELRQRYLPP